MFTQPINQTGLAGFIPLRRQEGGVPNEELNIGAIAERDIFGSEIDKTNIPQTTTNIGQLPSTSPSEFSPGLSSLNVNQFSSPSVESFFDPTNETTTTTGRNVLGPPVDVNTVNTTEQSNIDFNNEGGLSNFITRNFSKAADQLTAQFDPNPKSPLPGIWGSDAAGKLGSSLVTGAVKAALPASKILGGIAPVFGDLASTLITGDKYTAEDFMLSVAEGALVALFPPAGIAIALYKLAKMAFDFFSETPRQEFETESKNTYYSAPKAGGLPHMRPSSPTYGVLLGTDADVATSGLGTDGTSEGEYSDFGSVDFSGIDFSALDAASDGSDANFGGSDAADGEGGF